MSILNVLVGVGMITSFPKVDHADSQIPDDLEVGYIPLSFSGAYPGLYIFTSPSRFIRPVRNISIPSGSERSIELIGPFEQVFMEIRCSDGGDGDRSTTYPATHEEIDPTGMLSMVANLTPWSDHNQSPLFLGTVDGKANYDFLFASNSLPCRSKTISPSGTNAIVAVLSYTGYDMEDTMILNKSSVERGMCRGQIYRTETIDLTDEGSKFEQGQRIFRRDHLDKSLNSPIDPDGLPYVGQVLHPNEPYCSTINQVTNSKRIYKRKGSETVIVDYVSVDVKNKNDIQKNPIIRDKFSSRHGQKGVCSQFWPDIDMPFSGVTGMHPDLIINPHAFPSRMTIGMLLESVAAKRGSFHVKFVDATPFSNAVRVDNGKIETKSSESLVDELGSMLRTCGFNYHGTEVRFTGQVDQITRQSIKGTKCGGGIRFGEMERDSMLACGAAYLLHDRLHTCSDHLIADVCSLRGSILTASLLRPQKPAV
ncbi:hypothetical protein SLEP1_g5264 [Rubroshorea leprosula]|uniref:DNA-directed RNA polymerase n=1 Tax=Rubroshorea leprosula TaxID=152421 RepID=A0AAV5I0B7_9ROSI|nr:hypothetical protein SLEP1_g5264 [Rubroshorea leprosula]